MVVKVWTSLSASGGDSRAVGKDSIKVSAAYESDLPWRGKTNFGIYKGKRVFRTGTEEAVIDRLYERMREAYVFTNEWLRRNWDTLPKRRSAHNKKATS